MSKIKYGYNKKVNYLFNDAKEKLKAELQKEGFGILTEIDVKTTLKNKINVDIEDYIILGACNPSSAYKSLLSEKEIGLMLPCNVIIYRQGNDVFVSAVLPTTSMGMIDNKSLKTIALGIESKLKKVIDRV